VQEDNRVDDDLAVVGARRSRSAPLRHVSEQNPPRPARGSTQGARQLIAEGYAGLPVPVPMARRGRGIRGPTRFAAVSGESATSSSGARTRNRADDLLDAVGNLEPPYASRSVTYRPSSLKTASG